MEKTFSELSENWFSIGLDVDFYSKVSALSESDRKFILEGLRDVAYSDKALAVAQNENVYTTSLLRGVSEQIIKTQYRRVIQGGAVLTSYRFEYNNKGSDERSPVELSFNVEADSKPPTNIHVLIGRNGIGKTTILNGMVAAIHPTYANSSSGEFRSQSLELGMTRPNREPLNGLISISFSVFDPFVPPPDSPEPKSGPKYAYLGMKTRHQGDGDGGPKLKSVGGDNGLKTEEELLVDFEDALRACMSQEIRRKRWLRAINRLESDENFAAMRLSHIATAFDQLGKNEALAIARRRFEKMSSGHKIVLLTTTALVHLVEEKTLVLMDEPESHLHPPLLSAFTRALSEILHDRNGVAIVATHSPVMVQEVPRSCVWKISRSGLEWRKDRPARETFAENVGILTSEVFGLEVSKSGFHAMLQEEVDSGSSFEEIMESFGGKIGMEGISILASMIASRDSVKTGEEN
ncbi:TPA: AAA family ATPase [Stenotrophomonas maltophilia]